MAKVKDDPKHPSPTAPGAHASTSATIPAPNDPIEGAKIGEKPTPPVIVLPPPKTAEAPPPPSEPTPERYVVTAKTTISLLGQLVTLNPDDVVSAASYGPEGFRRIRESNVPMRRIEDLPKS